MYRSIQFTKLDYRVMKTQNKTLALFVVLALILSVTSTPGFAGIYMLFVMMILATTPFSMDYYYQNGFVALLPAKVRNRVSGRYLFGISYLLIGLILGETITAASSIVSNEKLSAFFLIYPVVLFFIAAIFLAMQYTLLYALGKEKQSYMKFITMVPGFIIFFAGSAVGEKIEKINMTGEMIYGVIAGTVVLGIAVFFIFQELSVKIMSKKSA